MKFKGRFQNTLKGLIHAVTRFPLTSVLLLAACVVNALDIAVKDSDYSKYLLSLVVGALIGAVAQVIYERFFTKVWARVILFVTSGLLALGYYFVIMPVPRLSVEISVRTSVAMFALLIAFIWIPSIKGKISFNESFMVVFKAFFIALFFSVVIFAGTSIIIGAIDELLFDVDTESYSHAANIVFTLFAPIYFLGLIPVYFGRRDKDDTSESAKQKEEKINRMALCPKYLEILISYIIIPLVAVFTIILVIYILLNIGKSFWTNNLLEPMIVSYSITVIIVYILTSRLENNFSLLYRRIFPKVLVPIVLFQIISSVIRIGETGITYTRYYVILFGIFAVASGLIFSFLPVRKNGIIAAILIILSAISIVPPVDAFTVSRTNQMNILKDALIRNNMLEGNTIKPNPEVPEGDKKKIVSSLQYLDMMNYTHAIEWLPPQFNYYSDFYKIFGFYQYDQGMPSKKFISIVLQKERLIDISGYDAFMFTNFYISGENTGSERIGMMEKDGKEFTLIKEVTDKDCIISLLGKDNEKIISISTSEIFERFEDYPTERAEISLAEATFSQENQQAIITLVVDYLHMELPWENRSDRTYYSADINILVKIK